MNPKRIVAAFFLSQLLVAGAFAQSTEPPSEFGQASGGSIDVMTKRSARLSGSLGITAGNGKGYDATLGGTLVPDRVWFFASAQKSDSLFGSQYGAAVPTPTHATDARMTTQLGDRQNLAASFAATRTSSAFTPNATLAASIPSSFLSLHYTGIVSSNMFVTASFSELRRSNNAN